MKCLSVNVTHFWCVSKFCRSLCGMCVQSDPAIRKLSVYAHDLMDTRPHTWKTVGYCNGLVANFVIHICSGHHKNVLIYVYMYVCEAGGLKIHEYNRTNFRI